MNSYFFFGFHIFTDFNVTFMCQYCKVLVLIVLNMIKKYKVNINDHFSVNLLSADEDVLATYGIGR